MAKLKPRKSKPTTQAVRRGLVIDESSARKIQQKSQSRRVLSKSNVCTPAYQKIVMQLDDKHRQVFDAAVVYLVKIAEASRRYTQEILQILQQYAERADITPYRREFLEQHIKMLKAKNL